MMFLICKDLYRSALQSSVCVLLMQNEGRLAMKDSSPTRCMTIKSLAHRWKTPLQLRWNARRSVKHFPRPLKGYDTGTMRASAINCRHWIRLSCCISYITLADCRLRIRLESNLGTMRIGNRRERMHPSRESESGKLESF